MPPRVQAACASSLSYDPLPPIGAGMSTYDLKGAYWEGVESAFAAIGLADAGVRAGGGGIAREAVDQIQVFISFTFSGKGRRLIFIQAFLNANPGLAARFPNGAQELARMMIDDPAALFEGMLAEGEPFEGGNGEMPGGIARVQMEEINGGDDDGTLDDLPDHDLNEDGGEDVHHQQDDDEEDDDSDNVEV